MRAGVLLPVELRLFGAHSAAGPPRSSAPAPRGATKGSKEKLKAGSPEDGRGVAGPTRRCQQAGSRRTNRASWNLTLAERQEMPHLPSDPFLRGGGNGPAPAERMMDGSPAR